MKLVCIKKVTFILIILFLTILSAVIIFNKQKEKFTQNCTPEGGDSWRQLGYT